MSKTMKIIFWINILILILNTILVVFLIFCPGFAKHGIEDNLYYYLLNAGLFMFNYFYTFKVAL